MGQSQRTSSITFCNFDLPTSKVGECHVQICVQKGLPGSTEESRLERGEPGSRETGLEAAVVRGQGWPGRDQGKWREASGQGT